MNRRLKALALSLVAVLAAVALAGCSDGDGGTRTVRMHYTHFVQKEITIKAGQSVIFDLRNDDPIEHEWMVGDEAMHARHRTGTEPYHDSIPTEVTVPALSTKRTAIVFDTPGDYAYVCHLPGHEEYGMKGVLHVVAP